MYMAVWNYQCCVIDNPVFMKGREKHECVLDLLGPQKRIFLLIWNKLSWTDLEKQTMSCLIGKISPLRNAWYFQTQNSWLRLQIFWMLLWELKYFTKNWGSWLFCPLSPSSWKSKAKSKSRAKAFLCWLPTLGSSGLHLQWCPAFCNCPWGSYGGLWLWHISENSLILASA